MKFKFVLLLLSFFFIFDNARARDYYVSSTGNDANAGTSAAQAWQSIARVSTATLQPGDRVLFAGGQTFNGSIRVRSTSRGTASQPIVFRSFGAGRAVIASDTSFGFFAKNTAGIELRQLTFVGSGRLSNQNSGVIFYTDSTNAQFSHLRVDSLDISGYRGIGLSIASQNSTSGFANVRITNCQLHANGEAGLYAWALYPLISHRNWYVANCSAYDNAGRPDITDANTGNGIVLSGIDGAVIEHCTAYHNGWLNANPGGGPVGIWGWDCNNLTIQFCESHHNLSGTSLDGGGFDLDGGTTNSVMQYNYSHDNQGPGYLLCQFDTAPVMHDLTVRYNISENDARSSGQGAIELYSSGSSGGIVNANIYNNTVYVSRPANGSTPKAVYIMSDGVTGINFHNNILQTEANMPVVASRTQNGVRLEGNAYWTPNAALILDWGGATYNTLADWRAGTSQETLANGTRPTGLCASPCFALANALPASVSGQTPAGFNLGISSVLMGRGLNLAAEFNINPGGQDFFGNATPLAGACGNVGASEARSVVSSASRAIAASNVQASTWCQVYPTVVRDEIHLLADRATTQPVAVQLVDAMGRTARTWTLAGSQLQASGVTLPVSGLAAGRYVLRLQSGTQVQRQALVVNE